MTSSSLPPRSGRPEDVENISYGGQWFAPRADLNVPINLINSLSRENGFYKEVIMSHASTPSPEAESLLRRRLAGEFVAVTEATRPLYRSLVAAGLMEPISTFISGAEGYYRPTEAAYHRASGGSPSTPPPAPAAVPSPRG